MPIPLGQLIKDSKYVVTRVGATEPTMTGKFVELITEKHPYGPMFTHTLPVAKIDNYADREVGYYNDKAFTFELADPDNTAGNTPAGTGLNAVRALRANAKKEEEERAAIAAAAKLGGRRRRKTRKPKRRSRKTRRRHR